MTKSVLDADNKKPTLSKRVFEREIRRTFRRLIEPDAYIAKLPGHVPQGKVWSFFGARQQTTYEA